MADDSKEQLLDCFLLEFFSFTVMQDCPSNPVAIVER
jgi:hypothetical protein